MKVGAIVAGPFSPDRSPHWIKRNHQNRIPGRWIAFDTESDSRISGDMESQTWKMGAGVRWRHGLKRDDYAEASTFATPLDFWIWVTDYCRPGTRTVCVAHNLGYDLRISKALEILPSLGWRLEWCNLDRNVSAMTWRSDNGTLVLCDLWTWLPVPLGSIASDLGMKKLNMPGPKAPLWRWERYCGRDAEIVYQAKSQILKFIKDEDLGNWQPTGAGMAYAMWRHKFMSHNVLVHDDEDAIAAERAAMHTGRAEAWRHGLQKGELWTEVDMKNAYLTIAAECDLPTKLKFKTGAISNAQYSSLSARYRVLCNCVLDTSVPVVPCNVADRTLWPVGTFKTWLWDTEVDQALRTGATVSITSTVCYTREPILREWALYVLGMLAGHDDEVAPAVRTWLKHCGRALIGRVGLRAPRWEQFGANPEHLQGITLGSDYESGKTVRYLHIGDQTLVETGRTEGKDSLPQITSWIMAECRARLWEAMTVAGGSEIAHTDTDSLLVSRVGLARLRASWGDLGAARWHVKGSYGRLIVYGPRNYRAGKVRKVSGVPRKADEILPNVFRGERWHSVSSDLSDGNLSVVTIETAKWEMTNIDPRRRDAPGVNGHTVAVQVSEGAAVSSSSSSGRACGA